MTGFSPRLSGESLDRYKTVAKPSGYLLLDSNHLCILFVFQYKCKIRQLESTLHQLYAEIAEKQASIVKEL